MFLESEKDITDEHNEPTIVLRVIKPKLITSLNYEQEYLLKRKLKRNNRGRDSRRQQSSILSEDGSSVMSEARTSERNQSIMKGNGHCENNFYREVYDGNDKICGFWVNGLLEGEAEIEYQNGDYFKGKFEKGYKVSGTMSFKDNGSYTGTFQNQQFHGKGTLTLQDKTISAQWTNGVVEGSSVIQYSNGNVYYGPVKEFKKHGYGYLYFPNDTKFFGQFVDGMIKGYGEFYEKGKLKCKGLWKNGKLMQEKKEDDWSYNFEEENVNWELIEELFQSRQVGMGTGSFFQTFLPANSESDQNVKEILGFEKLNHSIDKQNESFSSESESDTSTVI